MRVTKFVIFFFNLRAELIAVFSVLFLVPLNSTQVELEKKEKCLSVDESKKNITRFFFEKAPWGKVRTKLPSVSFL